MKTHSATNKASPDPSHREKQWFSKHFVPARHTHLSSGEPVGIDLFDLVRAGIADSIKALKTNHPYKAWRFIPEFKELHVGDRRRAGRCIADFARRPGSPIGLIRKGKRQAHRYFVRPVEPQSLTAQAGPSEHHQP